jgi:hypothetical protein
MVLMDLELKNPALPPVPLGFCAPSVQWLWGLIAVLDMKDR